MNSTLIIPAAGLSTRYGGLRPKWMFTDPTGKLVIEKVLENIKADQFERVIFVTLKEFEGKYFNVSILQKIFEKIGNIEILLLEDRTSSQTETVVKAIQKENIVGPIFIKDCDNYFSVDHNPGQNEVAFVSYVDLGEDPRGKSFIKLDQFSNVAEIVEKKIISENFCCGGYAFKSAAEFIKFHGLANPHFDGECYVSNVIFQMLLVGELVQGVQASNYVDLGTVEKYQEMKSQYATLFLDFDGVLVKNSSKFDCPPWKIEPILDNLQFLKDYLQTRKITLIISTARPSSEKSKIMRFLNENEIVPFEIITDLPHARRIVVNDFAGTNIYPTAEAINIPRNEPKLKDYLK